MMYNDTIRLLRNRVPDGLLGVGHVFESRAAQIKVLSENDLKIAAGTFALFSARVCPGIVPGFRIGGETIQAHPYYLKGLQREQTAESTGKVVFALFFLPSTWLADTYGLFSFGLLKS